MRYGIIDTVAKTVINVIDYDIAPTNPPPGFEAGIIAVQSDLVGPDWTWNGADLVPPVAAPIVLLVPQSISDRQFFQQLAVQGIITNDDALAAVKTGTLPSALQTLITQLPTEQQFSAQMLFSGATTFERTHPMTIAIGTAYGWTPGQIDALFQAAAVL